MSNLVEHAKAELRLMGYTGEEPEGDMNRMMWDNIIAVVQVFADGGHSGASAGYALSILEKLLAFKNLKPLTNNPEDWIEVGPEVWQCRRNSAAFSKDGGKTYTVLGDPGNIITSEEHKA